eukprot:TRINITY_DN2629_c0_g3_i1.p1 TRINITY_DN2629_c0_g3~~TRINITY_DN2629_c0_g3_i1.p1  ORF type:complete len:152 (+),score=22.98 TRINITY_DN2629_c0_g3_i1:28-456(+)
MDNTSEVEKRKLAVQQRRQELQQRANTIAAKSAPITPSSVTTHTPSPIPAPIANTTNTTPTAVSQGGNGTDGTTIRESEVLAAVGFLTHANVVGSPDAEKRSYLKGKGLSDAEIDEGFRRASMLCIVCTFSYHSVVDSIDVI